MAKSMYDIIESGSLEVDHKGETVDIELPGWVKELSGKLEDEEALQMWATEHEIFLPIFHYFIKQLLIALRAQARPQAKMYKDLAVFKTALTTIDKSEYHISENTGELSKRISCDMEDAQTRVDEFVCKPTARPGTGTAKAAEKIKKAEENAFYKMAQAMYATNVDVEVIKSTLSNATDSVSVALIMNKLEESND